MGLLKSAFSATCRLHSRSVVHKRLPAAGNATLYSPARATPSNYFRYLAGPSQTVITGTEFVIPVTTMIGTQVQLISFATVPTMGAWEITYNSTDTSPLNFDATAADIQVALRLISGLEFVTVTGDYTVGFSITMYGIQTPLVFTVLYSTAPDPVFDAVATVTVQTTGVPFSPVILRGDKILDGSKTLTVKEIIDIPDLGGEVMGYRVRVE